MEKDFWKKIIPLLIFYLGILSAVVFIANWRFDFNADPAYEGSTLPNSTLSLFYGHNLDRWDSGWYRQIAESGYQGRAINFFPLLPLLISVLLPITNNFAVAASLVTLAAMIFGLFYFYKFARTELNEEQTWQSVWWLLFFPSAVFFFAPYTESLFFGLLMFVLFHLKKGNLTLAGIGSFLLALTRVTGVLVFILLLFELIKAKGNKTNRIKYSLLLASPIFGLFSFSVFSKIKFGSWFAFIQSQGGWDRNVTLNLGSMIERWTAYLNEFQIVFSRNNLAPILTRLTDLAFLIFAIVVIILIYRKWRKDYAIWMAAMVGLPLLSGTLLALPRYVLPLPFTYIFLAKFIKNQQIKNALQTVFVIGWTLFLIMFSGGYWVA